MRALKLSRLSKAVKLSFLGLSLANSVAHAATITVTSPLDDNGENCTLREAIQSSNTSINQNNGCAMGSTTGTDTIIFSNSLPNNTITLRGGALEVSAGKDIEINANMISGGITLDGNEESALLSIRDAFVTLNSISLTGGFSEDIIVPDTDERRNGNTYADPIIDVGDGRLVVLNSNISNNSTAASSGIIRISNSEFQLHDSSISDNSGTRGGILTSYGGAQVQFERAIITDNQSPYATIFARDPAITINNSTISNNTITDSGSSIIRWSGSGSGSISNSTISANNLVDQPSINLSVPAVIANTTVSGNSVSSPSLSVVVRGGGIQMSDAGLVQLINTTITNNTAPNLALNEISANGRTTLSLKNSIVANAVAGADCLLDTLSFRKAIIVSDSNSIVEDDGTCQTAARAIDPRLKPLANNGGLTRTHALSSDSPAIDSGDNETCQTIDQRGKTRPLSLEEPCDVGAFEVFESDRQEDSEFFVIPLPNRRAVIFNL